MSTRCAAGPFAFRTPFVSVSKISEFAVDSGASMHMISKKGLGSAELETVTTSRSPTTVITANGEVQRGYSLCQRIGYILDNESPRGYASSFIARKALINGQKPHLIKNCIRIQCNTENFVPIVVPGLSASSSSSLSTSTPTTPSKEIDHSDHPPAIVSSESVDRQVRRDLYVA